MGNLKRGMVIAAIALVAVAVIVFRNLFTLDDGQHQVGAMPDTGQGVPAAQQAAAGGGASQANGAAAVTPADAAPSIPGKSTALAPTGASDAGSRPPADAAGRGAAPATPLELEARAYVQALAAPTGKPLAVTEAEGFVGPGRSLAPDAAPDAVPNPAANVDFGHRAATPPGAPAARGATPPGSAAGKPETAPAHPAEATRADPGPLTNARVDVPGTAAPDQSVDRIPDRRTVATAPAVVDLPVSEQAPVTIAELLAAQEAIASDAVFYVHTVQPGDDQGIWGIVHHGIVENFAAGVALHRAGSREVYRVDIPPDADQIEAADRSSSFLGKLIYEKSQQSYVYNYRTERLGRNPDLIFPGQQIVIVSFTPDELVAIYKHFARQG